MNSKRQQNLALLVAIALLLGTFATVVYDQINIWGTLTLILVLMLATVLAN